MAGAYLETGGAGEPMTIKKQIGLLFLMLAIAFVFALLLAITEPASAAIEDNLVACWDMDETSGTRYDSAGSNDLTDNNTVGYTTGKINNSAEFVRANNEYLSITDNNSLSFSGDFTISIWLYNDDLNNGDILSKSAGSANTSEYWIQYNSGQIYFYVSNGASSAYVTKVHTTSGSWIHIVALHDSTTNLIKLKKNNDTWASTSYSLNSYNNNQSLTIGYESTYFDGKIDVVSMWGRSLSDSEITDLYNSGNGRDCDYIVNAATPTPVPTNTPTPAPTATPEVSTQYTVTLTSGNPGAINRVITYGDIAIVVMLSLLFGSGLIMGVVYTVKRFMG